MSDDMLYRNELTEDDLKLIQACMSFMTDKERRLENESYITVYGSMGGQATFRNVAGHWLRDAREG
jgi:hypothetical protein